MYNLLKEPIIRMETSAGREMASLPGVLEALAKGSAESFPALRAHQQHSWHTFLVQLAAGALHREGLDGHTPTGRGEWEELLRTLTPEHPGDEPWQLTADMSEPAFMQVTADDGEMRDMKKRYVTPDEMDIVLTSKNHDFKTRTARTAQPDDWIFALLSLQTAGGHLGQGNYGISRMNMGTGNRSGLSLAPAARDPGSHFQRDLRALAELRGEILAAHPGYPAEGGILILWTTPWDGSEESALDPGLLDPMYVDMCRRIRLVQEEGKLAGYRSRSEKPRIKMEGERGITGDPWALIKVDKNGDEKVVTMPAEVGFRHHRMMAYLSDNGWRKPVLLRPTREEQENPAPMRILGRAMVRGQGKTQGYYRIDVPAGPALQAAILGGEENQELRKIMTARTDAARATRNGLGKALRVFMGKGNEKKVSKTEEGITDRWRDRLGVAVDETFIRDLQEELETAEKDRDLIRDQWLQNGRTGMLDIAKDILREGMASVLCPASAAHIARNKAEASFEDAAARIRRKYGGASPRQADGEADGQANGKKQQQKTS